MRSYSRMYLDTHAYAHTHKYIYIYMYTHTFTHTHRMGREHSFLGTAPQPKCVSISVFRHYPGLYHPGCMVWSPFARSAARIAPVGFVLGALIEFFMINVRIGSETFCKIKPGKIAHYYAEFGHIFFLRFWYGYVDMCMSMYIYICVCVWERQRE